MANLKESSSLLFSNSEEQEQGIFTKMFSKFNS